MLLIATLATSGMVPVTVALGLVLGANIGSGVLAMLATANADAAGAAAAARQPDLQGRSARSLLSSLPAAGARRCCSSCVPSVHQQVVLFHLGFNVVLARALHRLHRPGRPHRRPLAAPTRTRAPAACGRATSTRSALDHAVARDQLRGARGAAPGRRRRDDAARHPAGAAQQRPACSPSSCASSTTRSTSSTRRSSST